MRLIFTRCHVFVIILTLLGTARRAGSQPSRPSQAGPAWQAHTGAPLSLTPELLNLTAAGKEASVYLNADAHASSNIFELNEYLKLGRGVTLSLHLTPVLNSSVDVKQYLKQSWADYDLLVRDESWYMAHGASYVLGGGVADYAIEKPIGMMHPRTYLMLFYRQDWFDQLGIKPPETWEQMQALAQNTSLWQQVAANSSKSTSLPSEVTGLCLDLAREGAGSYLLMAIWASVSQNLGMFQGLHFNPETFLPLINTPSMREAARIFIELAGSTDAASRSSRGPLPDAFLQGRCAMTVGWDFYVQHVPGTAVSGKAGFSPLPGSEVVWHRESVAVGAETRVLRKFCRPPQAGVQYTDDNDHESDGDKDQADQQDTLVCPYSRALPNGQWLNIVQVSALLMESAIISPESDLLLQSEAVIMQAFITRPNARFSRARQSVMDKVSSQLNASTGNASELPASLALTDFLQQYPGMAASDADRFFRGLWTVQAQRNTAPELVILDAAFARAMFFDAVQRLLDGGLPVLNEVLAATQAGFEMVWNMNAPANKDIYLRSIDWASRRSWDTHTTQTASKMQAGIQMLVIVLPSLAAALLLGLFIKVYAKRQATHNRTFLGHVKPPGVSVSTSLLVTDIEDSTHLWESIDQQVMDQALTLHHGAIRSCIAKHHAYEVATEGDSFIISTFTALQAVQLSIDIHDKLLKCDWPEELLEEYQCHQMWVTRRAPGSKHGLDDSRSLSRGVSAEHDKADSASTTSKRPQKQGSSRWFDRLLKRRRASTGPSRPTWATNQDLLITSDGEQYAAGGFSGLMSALNSQNGDLDYLGDANREASDMMRPVTSSSLLAQRHSSIELSTLELSGPPNQPRTQNRRASFQSFTNAMWSQHKGLLRADTWTLADARDPEDRGASKSLTVQQHLEREVRILGAHPCAEDMQSGETYLVFGGFRVRMGIATGVEDVSHAVFDKASGRMQYTGPTMEAARALAYACPGGQILLADTTQRQLPLGALPPDMTVAHMGEYLLKDVDQTVTLYTACKSLMVYRFLLSTDTRCLNQVSASFLDAPCKVAAIAFMYVVGVQSLSAWDTGVTSQSLEIMHNILKAALAEFGGYLVELPNNGLCLASFSNAKDAVHWALTCIQLGLTADWPEALMGHELGEEVLVPVTVPNPYERTGAHSSRRLSKKFLSSRMMRQLTKSFQGNEDATAPASAPFDLQSHLSLDMLATAPQVRASPPKSPVLASTLSLDGSNQEDGSVNLMELPSIKSQVLFRGLRLKCGIDLGKVSASVHATSSRITYRGRVMNRAARVSSAAKTGQVWCTESAWAHSQFKPSSVKPSRAPSSAGIHESQTILNAAPSVPISVFQPAQATFFDADGDIDHTSIPDLPGQGCPVPAALPASHEGSEEVRLPSFETNGIYVSSPGTSAPELSAAKTRPILQTSTSNSGTRRLPGAKVSFKVAKSKGPPAAHPECEVKASSGDGQLESLAPIWPPPYPQPGAPHLTTSSPLAQQTTSGAAVEEVKVHINLLATTETAWDPSSAFNGAASTVYGSMALHACIPDIPQHQAGMSAGDAPVADEDLTVNIMDTALTAGTDEAVVLSMAQMAFGPASASRARSLASGGSTGVWSLDHHTITPMSQGMENKPQLEPARSETHDVVLPALIVKPSNLVDMEWSSTPHQKGTMCNTKQASNGDLRNLASVWKAQPVQAVALGPVKLKGVMETVRVVHCSFERQARLHTPKPSVTIPTVVESMSK